MKKVSIVVCFAFASLVLAQQALTNESVLKLVKADMGDDVIVNMINSQPANFSLGTDDLIALKGGGVSQKVISAMLLKNSSPAPTAVAAAPAAGPVNEIGVYFKAKEGWKDIEPEIVNFKS